MKTQFETVSNYFKCHGDELTERDYKEALHLLNVNDHITDPTDDQVIAELERLIEIAMEDLDYQEIYGGF
jgi:hypothetical protein